MTPTHDAWAQGDYHRVVGQYLTPVARETVAAVRPRKGMPLLDVGCGTGNATLDACGRGCDVTALDFSRGLLTIARTHVAEGGFATRFIHGDAQHLPLSDARFDATVSVFAHVFAPDPDEATREAWRVTKPGGTLAFTAWREDGASGTLMDAIMPHFDGANPKTAKAGLQLARPDHVAEVLDVDPTRIHADDGTVAFPCAHMDDWFDEHASASPGMIALLANFVDDTAAYDALRRDMIQALTPFHTDGALHMNYRRIVAHKPG